MSTEPTKHWTFEEYVAWEELQEDKHEFYDGMLFDQVGSAFARNRILINLHLLFARQFHNDVCQTSGLDLNLRCPSGFVVTPDVVVICEPPDFTTGALATITNPSIVIDLMTPETSDSKGGPLIHEMVKVKSLTHYIEIAQERPYMQIFQRYDDHHGLLTQHTSGTCVLDSIGHSFELNFEDVYRGVTFPALKWFNGPRKLVR